MFFLFLFFFFFLSLFLFFFIFSFITFIISLFLSTFLNPCYFPILEVFSSLTNFCIHVDLFFLYCYSIIYPILFIMSSVFCVSSWYYLYLRSSWCFFYLFLSRPSCTIFHFLYLFFILLYSSAYFCCIFSFYLFLN